MDDESLLQVSGRIDINNGGSLAVTNSNIQFTISNGGIWVHSGGSLTISPGTGSGTIDAASTTDYWMFVVEDGAGDVDVQGVTLDHMDQGIQLTGNAGTYSLSDLVITHARGFGVQLTDADASLSHLTITLDPISAYTENIITLGPTTTPSCPASGVDQWGTYTTYNCKRVEKNWVATAIGVSTLRGSPAVDNITVTIRDLYQRVDAELNGTYHFRYMYYGTYSEYIYNITWEYDTAGLALFGFKGVNSTFTKFETVSPVIDNVTAEVHGNIVGTYGYTYDYGWAVYNYNYPYLAGYYGHNVLILSSQIVAVYLENAGLSNIDGLDLTMGTTSFVFFNDWNGGGQLFYKNYWATNHVRTGASQVFGLYSLETTNINTVQAVTPTNVAVTNSILRRAGVRVDRFYNYLVGAAASGVNDTIFRGTVTIDNVQILDSPASGVEVRLTANAVNTFNTYDFTVAVKNSYFRGARAFQLVVNNKPTVSTSYTATFDISNNTFLNGSVRASTTFDAIMVVNTGGHVSSLTSDRYRVDFRMTGNSFYDMKGPLVGIDYSDFRFAGGAEMLLEDNYFQNVSNFDTSSNDAFLKTTIENVTLRGNTFVNFSFVFGVLGGIRGSDSYYEWPYYIKYGQSISYARSYPFKTAHLVADGNTFEGVRGRSSTYSLAFFNLPGRGHAEFTNNVVNNSTALWGNLLLNFYSYYMFPTEDLDFEFSGNVISNQSNMPLIRYLDPYKSGQGVRMDGNAYRDSNQKMFDWKQVQSFFSPQDYRAALSLTNNTFYNITGDAAHLTGRSTVTGNLWDGVTGWCLIVDWMSKVPDLATNTIRNSGNGYQFTPVVVSGIVTTSIFTSLVIDVTGTGIQMANGNMLIFTTDFGAASIAVDVRNGYAEVYSSRIGILSGRPAGEASIDVYNDIGYEVHWADANGVDSGVPVDGALVVTFSQDNRYLTGGRTDSGGILAKSTVEVWRMVSFGTLISTEVFLPFNVIATKSGITRTLQLPQLNPGETLTSFEDHPQELVKLIDDVVPTISIGSPLAGETVGSTTVVVEGYTFERGSGVATQRVRIDGGAWTDIPAGSATWRVTLAGVPEGQHLLSAEVSDIALNAYSVQVAFVVDVTPPTLTLTSPLEEATLTNAPVFDIRGHVEPVDSQVALNGITLAVNSRGDFFYNYSLADGLNVLRFTATDSARNQVVVVRQVEFDRYAPFLQVDTPVNGLLTNFQAVDVVGRSERDALVTVNGLPAFVNPIDGTFVLPEVLLDDLFDQTENLLVIRATDKAGNVRFENRTVIVDTKAPAIDLDLDPEVRGKIEAKQPVSASTLNVRGTTDSVDAVITIAGQEVPLSGLSFTRVLVLREGLNVIEITSADEAGNMRDVTLRVIRDTVKPVLTLESPSEPKLLTNQTTLLVSGYTDTEGSVVTIVYTDARGVQISDPVPTVPVGLPVQYRFEYTLVLNTDGNIHVVDVRASDLAGNFDRASFEYTAKVGEPFLEIIGFKTRTTDTFVWINGTTEAGIDTVRINGQEFDVVGQFFAVRWNLPIQEGNYTFTVSVRDQAGNEKVYQNRTEVHAAPPPPPPPPPTPFYASPTFQVGLGAGLFGTALAVLAMALARRRETE